MSIHNKSQSTTRGSFTSTSALRAVDGHGQHKPPTVAQVLIEHITTAYSREKAAQDGIYFWPEPLPVPGASFVLDPLVLFRPSGSGAAFVPGSTQPLADNQHERIPVIPVTLQEAALLRNKEFFLNAILSNGRDRSPDGLMRFPLGLIDIPNEQKRDTFCVDLHGSVNALTGGPLFIAGVQGSGKATALQTILLWLITRYTPAQLRLAIIDPNHDLDYFQDLPYVRTSEGDTLWTDGDNDEQLVQITERCTRLLAQRRESYPYQRWEENTIMQLRSRGAELPLLLLIISNYHSFVERFKATDTLKRLVLTMIEARALGAYVIVTSAEVTSKYFPADLMGKMGTKIGLFLNEQQRYDLLGRSPALELIPGRGLVVTRDRLMNEVQLALPVAGDTESIRNETLKREIAWLGSQL